MKTQDRQSLVASPVTGRHARTPPSTFPFLHITMSKSHRAVADAPSRTPNGSKSPIRSQRQPQRILRRTQVLLRFCPRIARSRIVPQEWERPARRVYLSATPALVKGVGNRSGPFRLSPRL